jgi:hypothetical protein
VTLLDSHGDLPAHVDVLLGRLAGLRRLFAPAKVGHVQHMQHAERARNLADHLQGILVLSSARHYAATFVLARTALEHHLLDRLVFLANRWIVVNDGIKAADALAEEARLAALKAGPRPDIVRWWYEAKSGSMHVIVRGRYREGHIGRGWTLSPYYFRIDQYDPFTVQKSMQGKVATAFQDPESVEAWAAKSAATWSRHFKYRNLRKNLDINQLLRPRLGVQVDVHYAFLSAYVHGAKKAHELVYGHNIPNNVGDFDHFASELALLYVVVIAAAELDVFGRMAQRSPRLPLHDWLVVKSEVAAARAASGHLWFLSDEPHTYDRIHELDTRTTRPRPGVPFVLPARPDPSTLDPSEVRYYVNPLDRLVKLHHSYHELMTGQVYQSPFDRPDIRRW